MMSLMFFVHKFLLSCRTLEANAPHFLQHLRPCHMWKLRLHLFYLSFSDFNIAESNTKTKRSTPRWASLFCISCIIWCSGKHHSYIWRVAIDISKRNMENINFVVALSHRSQWGVGQILPCFYSQHLLLWYPHSISSTIFGSEKRSKYLHYCSCDLLQQEIFVNIGG